MCIVSIAWQCFADIPVFICNNRDEFLQRPTLPLHLWATDDVLAAQDQTAGGTWLGINPTNGRWACVLNVREKKAVNAITPRHSRGSLVSNFLQSDTSPRMYAQSICLADFDGFNLIVGDRTQAFIVSNRGQQVQALTHGLHVFSNGDMTGSQSAWFKCEKLRSQISQEVLPLLSTAVVHNHNTQPWQTTAFHVLKNTTKASFAQLPDTGMPAIVEKQLSSVFINKIPLPKGSYGTQSSTVIILSHTHYQYSYHEHASNNSVVKTGSYS